MFVLRFLAILLFLLGNLLWAQSGGLDPSFEISPPPNGVVRAIATQSDGNVIIGGDFTQVGGFTRGRLARVTPQGGVDATFATGAGANGTIRRVIVQTDGKILIAGDFTEYDGVARGRIARLNTNGTLDATFFNGAGANGPIHAMVLTGSVVRIGGEFTSFNGQTRNRVASLSNGFLENFNPDVDGPVYAIAVNGNSTVIGGDFQTVKGVPRPRVACISSSGGLDSGFRPLAPNGAVRAIHFRDQSLDLLSAVIGGEFTALGSLPRTGIAFLNRQGELHPSESPSDIQANGPVFSIVGENAGFAFPFIIGGGFTEFGGLSKSGIVRVADGLDDVNSDLATPVIDTAFNSAGGPNGRVLAMHRVSGRIYVAGEFIAVDGVARPYVARLYGIYGPNPPPPPPSIVAKTISEQHIYVFWGILENASAYRLERSADGGANWTQIATGPPELRTFLDEGLTVGASYSYRVFATNPNGSSAPSEIAVATTRATPWTGAGSIDSSAQGTSGAVHSTLGETVTALEIEPDGKIVIGGRFNSLHGAPANSVARLNADWTVDPTFNVGAGAGITSPVVRSIARNRGGGFVVAGVFSEFQGAVRKGVARISSAGVLDTTFNPGETDYSRVLGCDVDREGRPVVFGSFSSFGGTPSKALVRLKEQGGIDSSFAFMNSAGIDFAIPVDAGGYFVGGSVPVVPGVSWAPYGRISTRGLLDTSFAQVESGSADAAAVFPDGSIIFAGLIPRPPDGNPRAVVKIKPDGTIDPNFDCIVSVRRQIYAVAVQPDGKVIIGGMLIGFAGNTIFHVLRLNADGSFDTTFDTGAGANGAVRSIAVEDDGRIVVGGEFTKFNGQPVSGIVRLRGDLPPNVPPVAPATLSAATHSATAISISWSQVPGATRYFVEVSDDGVGNWTLLEAPSWQTTAILDYALTPGKQRFYRVAARNVAGMSAFSTAVAATTRNYTAFESWNIGHGFPAETPENHDADRDGLPQLVEFALARNPTIGDAEGALVTRISAGMLELSFTKARPDVAYTVEASDDLDEWDSSGVEMTGQPEVTARVPASSGQKFLRLRVSIP